MGGGPGVDLKGALMLSLHVTLRQTLGDWELVAVARETYGSGLEPVEVRAVWQSPLTGPEWDSDPLASVLLALRRWSELTIEDVSTRP